MLMMARRLRVASIDRCHIHCRGALRIDAPRCLPRYARRAADCRRMMVRRVCCMSVAHRVERAALSSERVFRIVLAGSAPF